MAFRVSFLFEQRSELNCGWSTNLWNSSAAVAELGFGFGGNGPVGSLATKLKQVLGKGAGLVAIRAQDVGANINIPPAARKIHVAKDPTPVIAASGDDTVDADNPVSAVLVEMTSDLGYKAKVWLRGIPDHCTSMGGKFIPKGDWINKFATVFSGMQDPINKWSLRAIDRMVPGKLITGFTMQGVVTCNGHGFDEGDWVRIKGAKNLTQANGLWKVINPTANTFQLLSWVAPTQTMPVLGVPKVTKLQYVLDPIKKVEALRASAHQVGRPFGLPGGRRKTRRKPSVVIPAG